VYTASGAATAQRKINCLGVDAEMNAPKALTSETSKASKGCGMGRGVPSRLGGVGERRKLPQWGLDRDPAENEL